VYEGPSRAPRGSQINVILFDLLVTAVATAAVAAAAISFHILMNGNTVSLGAIFCSSSSICGFELEFESFDLRIHPVVLPDK